MGQVADKEDEPDEIVNNYIAWGLYPLVLWVISLAGGLIGWLFGSFGFGFIVGFVLSVFWGAIDLGTRSMRMSSSDK